MTRVNPYLAFKGNCEEAFNFYKEVFGGDFQFLGRYGDLPPKERQTFATGDNKIMHVSLPISKETILMGCDNPEVDEDDRRFGSDISLTIDTDSNAEADRIFKELSEGGKIKMSMNETFWGAYFGLVIDKFGISWIINSELKKT